MVVVRGCEQGRTAEGLGGSAERYKKLDNLRQAMCKPIAGRSTLRRRITLIGALKGRERDDRWLCCSLQLMGGKSAVGKKPLKSNNQQGG
jgi:hypothetical protein